MRPPEPRRTRADRMLVTCEWDDPRRDPEWSHGGRHMRLETDEELRERLQRCAKLGTRQALRERS